MSVIKHQKVRQSNYLVESPYAQEFSSHEIKLFEIAAAGVTRDDLVRVANFSNKKYFFNSNQIAALLNTSVSVISHEIEKTAARIMKKTIHLRKTLEDGSIEFEMINIIPYAKYKNGILELDLNYAIIPYLIEVNKNFTEFQLHYLLLLKSSYAIKLYKLLYQYKNFKIRTFSLVELKEQFGIPEKYAKYKDFKKTVLISSIAQINSGTDLTVDFNEIKLGRKVDKIEFNFVVKNPSLPIIESIKSKELKPIKSEAIELPLPNILEQLLLSIESELSVTTKELILKYYNDKGSDYVAMSIDYAKKQAKTNLDKYLNDTLVKGWAEVKVQKIIAKKIQDKVKVSGIKREQDKKQLEKEQDNLNKVVIEQLWNNLDDSEKAHYACYANYIFNKYGKKLTSFSSAAQILPLSVYAVSHEKSYDRFLESYVQNFLKVALSINNLMALN